MPIPSRWTRLGSWAMNALPKAPGVYEPANVQFQTIFVGSCENLDLRLHQHLYVKEPCLYRAWHFRSPRFRERTVRRMAMAEYKKPLPRPENPEVTKPFWEATKRHELVMQRCKRCANWIFYPREQCPVCFSQEVEYQKVSGRGRLHSYTTVYQPGHPAFAEETPYVFAIVQLNEGPRLPTNIVGIPHSEVKVDMALEAVYEDVTPEWTLVKFKPA